MIRRVFYYSGFRMKVFEWDGTFLLGNAEFEPDDEGYAEFKKYLAQSTTIPSQLLVDLIEEDFRRETIPHVNQRDRKAIISRLLDRHYRDETHIHLEELGRSKEGRRDDNLLLSALINNEILEPWLSHIIASEIPLAGIWSLPLLSNKLLPAVAHNEKNIMLVSQQTLTVQRESYFIEGKLMLSRQAKLERDRRDQRDRRDRRNDYEGDERRSEQNRRQADNEAEEQNQEDNNFLERRIQTDRRTQDRRAGKEKDTSQNAALSITKGTEQIHIFLTNQRIMGFTEALHVYCLLTSDLVEVTRTLIKDTNTIKYTLIDLNTLFAHYKLTNCPEKEADVLFSYLCSSMPLASNHYATTKEKYFYQRYRLERALQLTTNFIGVIVFIGASLLWLNSVELRQKQHSIDAQRTALETRYQTDYAPIEEQLADSANVQASVEWAQRIQQEAHISPQLFFTPLSTVFSESRFSDLQLEEFTWKKYSITELTKMLQLEQAGVSEPPSPDQVVEEPTIPESSSLQPLISISGYLQRGNRSYRDTVLLMESFADALRKMPSVTQVVIIKMPVDVRPALTFGDNLAGMQGQNAIKATDKEANEFQIDIGWNMGVKRNE